MNIRILTIGATLALLSCTADAQLVRYGIVCRDTSLTNLFRLEVDVDTSIAPTVANGGATHRWRTSDGNAAIVAARVFQDNPAPFGSAAPTVTEFEIVNTSIELSNDHQVGSDFIDSLSIQITLPSPELFNIGVVIRVDAQPVPPATFLDLFTLDMPNATFSLAPFTTNQVSVVDDMGDADFGTLLSFRVFNPLTEIPACSDADVTTTGATIEGQPGFGKPDGGIDLDDLGYFLNLWLAGCP